MTGPGVGGEHGEKRPSIDGDWRKAGRGDGREGGEKAER